MNENENKQKKTILRERIEVVPQVNSTNALCYCICLQFDSAEGSLSFLIFFYSFYSKFTLFFFGREDGAAC